MEWTISLVSDTVLMLFDLIMYMKLTPLKKNTKPVKILIGVGCFLMLLSYLILTYHFNVAYSVASFLCMTIPSLIMFFSLSKYKNARFLVTFCFVDTITLTIAAFSKITTMLGGLTGSIISCLVLIALCTLVLYLMWPHAAQYKELLDLTDKGFGSMAVCSLLIYILLIFAAAYPSPLITRTAEIPTYLLFCITVLSFYLIFIMLIKEKAKLVKANEQLKAQNYWKKLAFVDDLTQIGNKTAYDMLTNELETNIPGSDKYTLVLFDLDNLKYVNDNFGHSSGNLALTNTVDMMRFNLIKTNCSLFRVGGDEFVALIKNANESELQEIIDKVNTMKPHKKFGYSCSCGMASVDFNNTLPFKEALDEADKLMYKVKFEKKKHH